MQLGVRGVSVTVASGDEGVGEEGCRDLSGYVLLLPTSPASSVAESHVNTFKFEREIFLDTNNPEFKKVTSRGIQCASSMANRIEWSPRGTSEGQRDHGEKAPIKRSTCTGCPVATIETVGKSEGTVNGEKNGRIGVQGCEGDEVKVVRRKINERRTMTAGHTLKLGFELGGIEVV
ncbi:hypothetical protein EDB89DRAFT_1908461 [Lactarius sanguifluus]|nr:hypothetical protein EDB89DRAFT_1908461 [Lactarius sanguifluus]